jgi:nucleoside diphosphate kinase
MAMLERSLIVFKPDSVQRGIIGEVITRFEKAGLKIVGAKMLQPSYDHYYHHYENIGKMVSRRGQKVFDVTLEMMNEGPVIAFVLEGVEAVALVRKMVGSTEPKSALPGIFSMLQVMLKKQNKKFLIGLAKLNFSHTKLRMRNLLKQKRRNNLLIRI